MTEARSQTPRRDPSPGGDFAEIVPEKQRIGGFFWPGYASRVLAVYAATEPSNRPAFRKSQARYLELLRTGDRVALKNLMMRMSEIDGEGGAR